MTLERSIQLVACGFLVSTDDASFVERLDRLMPSAVQDHPVTRRHSFHALGGGDRWRVSEDGCAPEIFPDVDQAVDFVNRRLHELALDALADYTKVHAGCGTWHGRRFLVVGDRGAGKTTLMTRLLFEGCGVEGDEMVLLRDGEAVAYPRRFGIPPPHAATGAAGGCARASSVGGTGGRLAGGISRACIRPCRARPPVANHPRFGRRGPLPDSAPSRADARPAVPNTPDPSARAGAVGAAGRGPRGLGS